MPDGSQIVVGRSRDCDVQLKDQTVSGRHCRLTWTGAMLRVEDLGSANGTWIRDQRVSTAELRPGDALRLGRILFPWGHPGLVDFLRLGAKGDTILGMSVPGKRFICGSCGEAGLLPRGFSGGQLDCLSCGSTLIVGSKKALRAKASWGGRLFLLVTLVALAGVGVWVWQNGGEEQARVVREQLDPLGPRPTSREELAIRVHSRDGIVSALDSDNATTRNVAARLAAEAEGPFSVEQAATLWSHARREWRYVNDPQGSEYFARASETIDNGFVGDCDDFAIVLVAMMTAVGGRARLVMMDGPGGGHAYAEVCVEGDAESVRSALDRYYRRHGDRSLRQRVRGINYRPGPDCDLWLNLDWNAGAPGGPYEPETWSVAVYPDARTETLAPAGTVPEPVVP